MKTNNKTARKPWPAVCLACGLFLLLTPASRAEPTRALKAGDTMTGDLSLPGLSATYGVSAATGVIQSTATGDTLFSGATSTATFSGWIDIGIVVSSYTNTSGAIRVACPAGYKAITATCDGNTAGL